MKKTQKKDKLGRGLGCSSFTYAMLSVAGILSFLVIWQLLLDFGIISSRYLARPTELILLFIYKWTNAAPDGATLPVSIWASL